MHWALFGSGACSNEQDRSGPCFDGVWIAPSCPPLLLKQSIIFSLTWGFILFIITSEGYWLVIVIGKDLNDGMFKTLSVVPSRQKLSKLLVSLLTIVRNPIIITMFNVTFFLVQWISFLELNSIHIYCKPIMGFIYSFMGIMRSTKKNLF